MTLKGFVGSYGKYFCYYVTSITRDNILFRYLDVCNYMAANLLTFFSLPIKSILMCTVYIVHWARIQSSVNNPFHIVEAHNNEKNKQQLLENESKTKRKKNQQQRIHEWDFTFSKLVENKCFKRMSIYLWNCFDIERP